MCFAPDFQPPPGSRWTTPAHATRRRTASAPRSAMRTSPGSAPQTPRTAAISSTCCAPAMAITSSMPRRWPICAAASSPPRRSPAWPNTRIGSSPIGRPLPHISTGSASRRSASDPIRSWSPPRAPCGAASRRMASCPTPSLSATTPVSSMSANTACAGSMPRLVHKLDTFTDEQRVAQNRIRALIWRFYRALKAYRRHPTAPRKAALSARFDRILTHRTGFVTLDRLLARLHANKGELLMVLDRPEIPLHTNGSENDVRCQVTKRKISGGTRSDTGRDCRDAFLGLTKTCAKLGVAFWDYLGDRLAAPNHPNVPTLPQLIKQRCATA